MGDSTGGGAYSMIFEPPLFRFRNQFFEEGGEGQSPFPIYMSDRLLSYLDSKSNSKGSHFLI